MTYRCGAKTKDTPPGNGMPCANIVSSPDAHCHLHRGQWRHTRVTIPATSTTGLNPRPPLTRTARHVLAYIAMCEEPEKPFMADITKLPDRAPYHVQVWIEARIRYLDEKRRLLQEWADVLRKQVEIRQSCRELYECGAVTDELKLTV